MSVVSRRRFIAAVAGAALVSGCGATSAAVPATSRPAATQPPATAQPGAATSGATQAQPTAGATTSPALAAAASLAPGQGQVVNVGGQEVAIYKDSGGAVTLLSPKCTHQGCQVAWNGADGTWDCPCHGSRFNADGSVKNGPAAKPLASLG